MIKILFFIPGLSEGGAEKVLCNLVNNMDQTKFDITVQTIDEYDPKQYLAEGIRYKAVNRCKTSFGKRIFSYWFRLCAELKLAYPLYLKDDYDIEVAYLECGPTKILAGSANKNALKIAWVHCDLKKKFEAGVQIKKLASQYERYDKVVCVSENVRSSFIRLFGLKPESVVIHNVNDEEEIRSKAAQFTVQRTKTPVFAAVGRLYHQKGVDRLVEACKLLKENKRDFTVWIIGEGPDRTKLERMILDYGLKDHVKLWGFQENPYPYMAAADALVVPSRYEGLSTVAIEAMILGKPIVTTPCAGMDELLGNSEFGLITEDSVEGLKDGMKTLLDTPELMTHYAQAAAVRGRDFTKKSVLQETENFFISELERKRQQNT